MATELDNTPTAAEGGAELDAEPSLRDTIDAAFEEAATDDAPSSAPSGRARDSQGRFAAPAAAPAAAPVAPPVDPRATATSTTQGVAAALSGAAQGQQVGVTTPPPTPELKAPASWRPEVRERWASVPPEVQAEIHRRESEAGRVLQSAAAQRQFVEQFERLMQPYEMFIRAENSNPLAAVDNMMRTAAQLRVGTPAAKVDIVAGIIRNFGIDLPMLDAALAGAPQQVVNQPQQQQFRDPRVDQIIAAQQAQQQQQAAFEDQAIRTGLQQFASSPGHEFYGDVAGIMADLVEVQARQGIPVDLEKVYQRACQMHDGVATILQQRAAAANTSNNRAAVLRARRAAVSVKGDPTPGGATVPKNDTIRAAIEAAMDLNSDS